MAPERVPLAKAAKELGVSLREMQRLLAHAGVSAQKGAALLLPSQIEKAREQQSRERAGQLLATQQWLKPQPVVNVQLSEEEPRPVQPTEPKKRLIECPCCSVSLRWLPPDAESGDDQAMCAACEPHHSLENEPESRRWERLEEHTNRLRRAYEATEIHAHRLEVQCGRASEQLNKWREATIMILLDHAPSGDGKDACSQCHQSHPCRQIIEAINPGIMKKVERLMGLTDEQLQHRLRKPRRLHLDYFNYRDDLKRIECTCCNMTVGRVVPSTEILERPRCRECGAHFWREGEPDSRRWDRLEEHENRIRSAYILARDQAHRLDAERKQAFKQLDTWRRAAVRVLKGLGHADDGTGRCSQCRQPYRCRPWQIIDAVNVGIAGKAEMLVGFSDQELDRHLRPIRRRDADYNDDLENWA